MLVAALFNVGASVMNGGSGTGIVDFFHGLQVAIMMALMLNLVQFTYWTCKMRRSGSFMDIHRPTLFVLASAILVNIQPLWILIIGSWKFCCAECTTFGLDAKCTSTGMTYPLWPVGTGSCNVTADCVSGDICNMNVCKPTRECSFGGNVFWDMSYCKGKNYAIFPTQWQGWMVQIVCTWGGYILMFIGVFQATALHKKFGAKWRAIRRGQSQR